MSGPAYMPLFIADYLADTQHLSVAEHGAYMLLIMNYWRLGSLPNDEKKLARIARCSDREWKSVSGTIRDLFNDDWTHNRIEKELKKAREKSEARSEAGTRGGKAKALKNNDAHLANATILPEQNESKTLPSSSELIAHSVSNETQKPAKAGRVPKDYTPFFEMAWHDFPKSPNASKQEAFKAWCKLTTEQQGQCISGVYRYAEWLEAERRRRPDMPACHLVTFINQRRFEGFLENV